MNLWWHFQLQEAFEEASEERSHNKQALIAAQYKDDKSATVITELTAVSTHNLWGVEGLFIQQGGLFIW